MSNDKKDKQEIKDIGFSFGNIGNANELINEKKFSKDDSKIVYLFRIDKDFYHRFNFLKNERAIRQKKYDEYNSHIFIIMLSVVENYLRDKNIYENATEIFKHSVNRRGKRKANNRTVAKDRLEELSIYLSNEQSENYFNCFFSFIKNNPNEDINDNSFSKNYFFNDIIDIVSDNKDKFYKYKNEEYEI